jgi:predicted esterase
VCPQSPECSRKKIGHTFSWFDIRRNGNRPPLSDTVVQEEIKSAVETITKIIEQEVKLLKGDASRVFLGGFEQGGCIALATFLNLPESIGALGGVFAAGSAQCAVIDWKNIDPKFKKKTPIMLYNAQNDFFISPAYTKGTYDTMKKKGIKHFNHETEINAMQCTTEKCF